MLVMDEATLLAHAMRDYMRPFIDDSHLQHIEISMNAGEPYSALSTCMGIAQELSIAIPPLFIEKITHLPSWNDFDMEVLAEQAQQLPDWFRLAS